jgi:hypothetical protein
MTALDDAFDHVEGCMLLAWSGRSASFAVEAANIEQVGEEHEWRGEDVLDLTSSLDLDATQEPVRVLRLRSGASRFGLKAFGVMRLCVVAWKDVLDVPELVRVRGPGRLLRKLAVIDGAPALWILDADAMGRAAIGEQTVLLDGVLERDE